MLTERSQPWLGTLVSIRVAGLGPAQAHPAIDAAFKEVALVHRLMSFHDAASDVSRLNRSTVGEPAAVDPCTIDVLRMAQEISSSSDGCFDISVAAELVDWRMLPQPFGVHRRPVGCWRDIEILPNAQVVFHRPLWIDLGGIAKGYAVDRATERLRTLGAQETLVNAGGDIRVHGHGEPVRLAVETAADAMPILEVTDGSVAGSTGLRQRGWRNGRLCGPHVDGIHRSPAAMDRFVCVMAEQCMVADALTKVVMARGTESAETLRRFRAAAYMHNASTGWQRIAGELISQ